MSVSAEVDSKAQTRFWWDHRLSLPAHPTLGILAFVPRKGATAERSQIARPTCSRAHSPSMWTSIPSDPPHKGDPKR